MSCTYYLNSRSKILGDFAFLRRFGKIGQLVAQGFKQFGLGTIIVTNTYGWVIFTSGTSLVDGSSYRLPSLGCYTLDGKNLEKQGVKPDIYVETNFADRLNGRDPQLDRAIEEILKKIN